MEDYKIDIKIQVLAERCSEMLDAGDIESAVAGARLLQATLQSRPDMFSTLQKAEVASLLVDVGASSEDEVMIREGLNLFEQYSVVFSEAVHPYSLEYNLGNAKMSLYNIAVAKRQEQFRPEVITLLTEAKNCYWRALKLAEGKISLPELLTNLGNALDQCGRVVEALTWYDRALAADPAFGMAHFNRGLALRFLNRLSDTFSVRLIDETRDCFVRAEKSGYLPRDLMEQAQVWDKNLAQSLLQFGYTSEKIEEEESCHAEEFKYHDTYWRWCLENHLALSEHSLYCGCAGARRDDLSISKQAGPIGGESVQKLELLLNRIKSEFCLARALYYQGTVACGGEVWDIGLFEGTYTELYEGEVIGIRIEFLRTSFRLCFGVLDKIARGIANLFNLAPESEALYFESFWRPVSERNKGEERRWGLINQQENIALVALYSLATDLNRAGGEWSHFKEDRNRLEHGLLLVLNNDAANMGNEGRADLSGIDSVSAAEFVERTFRMLQFTVSAVFSFTFCVRIEGLKSLKVTGQPILLDKKAGVGKQ